MLLATTNEGKRKELIPMLAELGVDLISLDKSTSTEEIENGSTFAENALLKARTIITSLSGLPTIADDSGLEVLRSGRRTRNSFCPLWRCRRSERFFTRIVKAVGRIGGVCLRSAEGHASSAPRRSFGTGGDLVFDARKSRAESWLSQEVKVGFGYDPVFLYEPLGKTFAELTFEQKAKVSHRGLAFRGLARWLGRPWGA